MPSAAAGWTAGCATGWPRADRPPTPAAPLGFTGTCSETQTLTVPGPPVRCTPCVAPPPQTQEQPGPRRGSEDPQLFVAKVPAPSSPAQTEEGLLTCPWLLPTPRRACPSLLSPAGRHHAPVFQRSEYSPQNFPGSRGGCLGPLCASPAGPPPPSAGVRSRPRPQPTPGHPRCSPRVLAPQGEDLGQPGSPPSPRQ